MACNCIKDWNKKLKERYNETASVDYDLVSGRVIVNGLYHKLKANGESWEYQKKWREVMLWPKYCPFCGKPYDVKEIYGREAVIFDDNLICTQVELVDCWYDEMNNIGPIAYRLDFRFHDDLVKAFLFSNKLQTNHIEFSKIVCDGDLLKSFKNKFEYGLFSQKLCDVCKKHWERVAGKDSPYQFNGLKVE